MMLEGSFVSRNFNFSCMRFVVLMADYSTGENGFPELLRCCSPEFTQCRSEEEPGRMTNTFKRKLLKCKLVNLLIHLLLLRMTVVMSYGTGNGFLKIKLSQSKST
jgi:hypothetical protein